MDNSKEDNSATGVKEKAKPKSKTIRSRIGDKIGKAGKRIFKGAMKGAIKGAIKGALAQANKVVEEDGFDIEIETEKEPAVQSAIESKPPEDV